MNLYELAHHPDAYKDRNAPMMFDPPNFWFGKCEYTDPIQFDMLVYVGGHTDENEFRMHLLFVYFATTPESEWS